MADAKSKWNTDAHKESETEIADLAPYVSRSAVDAVRDAFRAIVLENQDHSELLDELLPQLKEEPSMRSQSLDWLDVELSHLSDDAITEFVGRLKRKSSQGLQIDREPEASEPEVARPPVEPATAPRGRLALVATAAVAMVCLFVTSYGWATAARDYRAEAIHSEYLQAEIDDVADDIALLKDTGRNIAQIQKYIADGALDHPEKYASVLVEYVELLSSRLDHVLGYASPQTDAPEVDTRP